MVVVGIVVPDYRVLVQVWVEAHFHHHVARDFIPLFRGKSFAFRQR